MQKLMPRVELKDADKGTFVALFSTFNVIDKDKDVTEPGAFEDGKAIPVSAYGHSSTIYGKLPVGAAVIKQTPNEAQAHGTFYLDTKQGYDTWVTVKRLSADGTPSEWSYGYDPLDYSFGEHEGQNVRFLKKVNAFEVSPVVQGAGIGTRTLDIKAHGGGPGTDEPEAFTGAIRPHETDIDDGPWHPGNLLRAMGVGASVPDLRSVHAYASPKGDPERHASYLFAHHGAPGGAASLRACMLAIAALNGAKGPVIPDAARIAVYEHLASHIRDAGREPPTLKSVGAELKLNEQALVVLANITDLLGTYAEVGASRALKGRALTGANLEVLRWVEETLGELRTMLDTPQETVAQEYARFVSLQRNILGA